MKTEIRRDPSQCDLHLSQRELGIHGKLYPQREINRPNLQMGQSITPGRSRVVVLNSVPTGIDGMELATNLSGRWSASGWTRRISNVMHVRLINNQNHPHKYICGLVLSGGIFYKKVNVTPPNPTKWASGPVACHSDNSFGSKAVFPNASPTGQIWRQRLCGRRRHPGKVFRKSVASDPCLDPARAARS